MGMGPVLWLVSLKKPYQEELGPKSSQFSEFRTWGSLDSLGNCGALQMILGRDYVTSHRIPACYPIFIAQNQTG